MPNVELERLKLSSWRKLALGTWHSPGDPSVYGTLSIDATRLAQRQALWRKRDPSSKPPTITAIVARATALTMNRYPQLNGLIRWKRIYLRKNVTLFLQTAVDDEGKELSGVSIFEAEKKSLAEIAKELQLKAKAIREDKDPNFQQAKSMFSFVPVFLMRPLLELTSFLMYTLNLDLRRLGLPKDPFGSAMITSIGSIGLDEAFAPLISYSRIPVGLAVGAVRDTPVVREGKIEIAPVFKIGVTFDHRFIDGLYGAKMAKHFKHLLETEEGLDQIGFI
ncbi:MAG: 2-oxo acid dehydrogenase subunit E2 [Bdellovibrionota bacterium]